MVFSIIFAMCIAHAGAAVRDGNATQRTASQKRISTTTVTERGTSARSATLGTGRGTTARTSGTNTMAARPATTVVNRADATQKNANPGISVRAATQNQNLTLETRTGAAYETCKSAFFTCMDQFCALKNDDYRRCSCSNRISAMEKQRATLNDAAEKLTVFTENLDSVGMTAAQALAMHTASDGENALANDTSASKALLQAIMNSISGGDTTISGKYSELNTINMSYDLSTAFDMDGNQIIASYNGQELYSAVYPQCRKAVAADCNSASLQRAVNAYLMAIEQDCNTVQTAIDDKRAHTKTAIRESSAMLDLARIENRRKHNSDDVTTCINNVEKAILSEEVCGANYHKCLDNGEFIDISTGAPIAGVIKFYELGNLLTFTQGIDAANQQLSKRSNNRQFVLNFENRTKKFAKPALDKCTEIADEVWAEYLDKAMLAIYYAQQAKVAEIKQGCFDFVSSCYSDSRTSITTAMSELMGTGAIMLEPNKIALSTQMCTDYVESCNNMFKDEAAGDIITQYVNNRQETDKLAACRAIVKQCFDKYGGSGYENFYYPYSGLFKKGSAGDWFTLYDKTGGTETTYKSPCAIQLTTVAACNTPEIIEQAFGGFDLFRAKKNPDEVNQLAFDIDDSNGKPLYGTTLANDTNKVYNRNLRPVGIATEVYNQIIDTLTTQCVNLSGAFVEFQFIKEQLYGGPSQNKNICLWWPADSTSTNQKHYITIANMYGIFNGNSIPTDFGGENMCPRDYNINVDTSFWGACLCWENGARRSKNGKSATCIPGLPVSEDREDVPCVDTDTLTPHYNDTGDTFKKWCTQQSQDSEGRICPYGYKTSTTTAGLTCTKDNASIPADVLRLIPVGQY